MGETLAGALPASASNLDAAAECFLLALVGPFTPPCGRDRTWQSSFRRDGGMLNGVRRVCAPCLQTLQPEEIMWYTGADGTPRSVHLRCGNLLAVVRRFADAARVFRKGIELSPPPPSPSPSPPPPPPAAASEDSALAPLRARLQVNLGVVLEAQVCRGWPNAGAFSAATVTPPGWGGCSPVVWRSHGGRSRRRESWRRRETSTRRHS
jgi:hypothetical protein